MTQISDLIEGFLQDAEPSIQRAGELEVALDDAYPDDDFVQETVEMLAAFRPEGGEFLFDAKAIKARLRLLEEHLETSAA